MDFRGEVTGQERRGADARRGRLGQGFPFIAKFQGKECLPYFQQVKKDPVASPYRQICDFALVNPLQHAFVAVPDRPLISRGRVEKHILRLPAVRDEGNHAPQPVVRQNKPRFLADFTQQTFFRTLILSKCPPMPTHLS